MNPVLIEFPDKIETDRLYIRPCMPGDGKRVQEAMVASHEPLKKWMLFAQEIKPIDEVESNIRQAYAEFIQRKDIRLHIFRKEDDAFIGATGLHRIDWNVRKFEIGYWIDQRHQKKGYMIESVKALTTFAFQSLNARRIEIRCDPNNLSSRNIPEKLGFTLEGILRSDSMTADGSNVCNTCVFAMLSHEWEQ